MDKYIILGPQGSGKGTQCRLLSQRYGFVHICIGDIFRWHMDNRTRLAARIRRIMDSGHLVPDDLVHELVTHRLDEHDWNWGFLLDGFPRTRPQAEYLFERWNLDAALYLDLPDDLVQKRVMERASRGDGDGYAKRSDDTAEALVIRLREYHLKTRPLVELFEQHRMLYRVDATRSIEEVFTSIRSCLHLPDPESFSPDLPFWAQGSSQHS